jgi:hypothetical protein
MSLLLLLNPKQYGGIVADKDTSDILDVYRRKKREYDKLEEVIAAQLLKARQTDLSIPKEVDADKLADILRSKLQAKPKADEVAGKERTKRIKVLLLLLAMDD